MTTGPALLLVLAATDTATEPVGSPGLIGFLVTLALVLACIPLFRSMTSKVRGVQYRDHVDDVAAEDSAAEDSAQHPSLPSPPLPSPPLRRRRRGRGTAPHGPCSSWTGTAGCRPAPARGSPGSRSALGSRPARWQCPSQRARGAARGRSSSVVLRVDAREQVVLGQSDGNMGVRQLILLHR